MPRQIAITINHARLLFVNSPWDMSSNTGQIVAQYVVGNKDPVTGVVTDYPAYNQVGTVAFSYGPTDTAPVLQQRLASTILSQEGLDGTAGDTVS